VTDRAAIESMWRPPMSEPRSPAYDVWHLLGRFLGRLWGCDWGDSIDPRVFVTEVREFLGSRDFLCAWGVPCHPRVACIERDGDERGVDLAVRFELVGTAEPEPVPWPTAPLSSAPRERRCSAEERTRSFAPLYHFTFRSDEALASNKERFREFLKLLPPPDELTSAGPLVPLDQDDGETDSSGASQGMERWWELPADGTEEGTGPSGPTVGAE
jgi:hypothetical protein